VWSSFQGSAPLKPSDVAAMVNHRNKVVYCMVNPQCSMMRVRPGVPAANQLYCSALSEHTSSSSFLLSSRICRVAYLIVLVTGAYRGMNIFWLGLPYTTSRSLSAVLCDIALPHYLLGFASSRRADLRLIVLCGMCSAGWLDSPDESSTRWSRGCGASSAGCGC